MSKKKIKPCSYYSGVESWQTKKRQKKEIDKKKEKEIFEQLELDNTLEQIHQITAELVNAIMEFASELKGENNG